MVQPVTHECSQWYSRLLTSVDSGTAGYSRVQSVVQPVTHECSRWYSRLLTSVVSGTAGHVEEVALCN